LAEAVLRAAGGEADVTGTGEDLPGDQERDEHIGHPGKVPAALDEVVLVAAVGVAGRVEVVLEQVDAPVDAVGGEPFLGVLEQALQDALTCLVLGDQLAQVVAFCGGVLGVGAHVQVQPGAIAEEHVRGTAPGHDFAEQVAGGLLGGDTGSVGCGAGQPELGLQAEDSADHCAASSCSSSVRPPRCRRRKVRRGRVRSSTAASRLATDSSRWCSPVPASTSRARVSTCGKVIAGSQASRTRAVSSSAAPPITTYPGSSVTEPS